MNEHAPRPGEGMSRVEELPQAPDGWVVVLTASSAEVFVAHGLLESNGIRSAVQRTSPLPPPYRADFTLRLCVAPEDEEQARELLAAPA